MLPVALVSGPANRNASWPPTCDQSEG